VEKKKSREVRRLYLFFSLRGVSPTFSLFTHILLGVAKRLSSPSQKLRKREKSWS